MIYNKNEEASENNKELYVCRRNIFLDTQQQEIIEIHQKHIIERNKETLI